MGNVLIVVGRFNKSPSANGIIARSFAKEISNKGYSVYCLSVTDLLNCKICSIDNVEVHEMESTRFTKISNSMGNKNFLNIIKHLIFRIIRNFKIIFLSFNFPNFDLIQALKVYKKVDELVTEKKINNVIFINKPFFNIAAAKRIKKKHPEMNVIAYFLDSLSSLKKPFFISLNIFNKLINKEYKKNIDKLDSVFIYKNEQIITEFKKDNIVYFDYPTFSPTKINMYKFNKTNIKKSKLVLLYAGTLDLKYRNPEIMLHVLNMLSDTYQIELQIYGNNNCSKLFNKYRSNNFRIINHGYIEKEDLFKKISNSDVLINISNKNTNAVPSKTFELISFGKPLFNLYFNKEDKSLKYFKLYPLSFNMFYKDSIEQVTNNLIEFLNVSKETKIKMEELSKIFYKNTLNYNVELILTKLKK